MGVSDSACSGNKKGAASAPFLVGGVLPSCRALGGGWERLYVAELNQERVLIVVAAAGHNPPLLVEVADFTERERNPASGGLQRTEWPVVCAFDGKLGDDNVSRVNILGIGDTAIREGLGPFLRPLSEIIPCV